MAQQETIESRALPNDRMSVEKQMEVLRGYAHAGPNGEPVGNNELARVTGYSPSSLSMCNSFFAEAGLISREKGGNVASAAVREFANAHEFNATKAAYRLAPVLKQAWFFTAIEPRLRMRPLPEDEVLTDLAHAGRASKKQEPQLRMLLDFLKRAGLVDWKDGSVSLLKPEEEPLAAMPLRPTQLVGGNMAQATPSPASPLKGENGIRFSVDIDVDMAQLSTWDSPRITAFFAGLAQVIAAKNQGGGQGAS